MSRLEEACTSSASMTLRKWQPEGILTHQHVNMLTSGTTRTAVGALRTLPLCPDLSAPGKGRDNKQIWSDRPCMAVWGRGWRQRDTKEVLKVTEIFCIVTDDNHYSHVQSICQKLKPYNLKGVNLLYVKLYLNILNLKKLNST